MTDDEILRMARAAGLNNCMYIEDEVAHLRSFAQQVAAAKQEECARLCDWLNGEARLTPAGCAAAIRARKG